MTLNVGILGAGNIAHTMAQTIALMGEEAKVVAVGARDYDRAKDFAGQYGIPRAYGSYDDLLADPEVQVVYIATPHSHHRDHMLMCLKAGKHILCEKAFTKTAGEAREVLAQAKESKLLVAEAIWTRYMPMTEILSSICAQEYVGKVHSLSANLGYPVYHRERVHRPELAGGALLDVGIYPLTFASIVFGDDIREITSHAVMSDTGVDAQNSVTLTYGDGRQAVILSSVVAQTDRRGMLHCDGGYIQVDNVNNFEGIRVFDRENRLVKEIERPHQLTGYEYQVRAVARALEQGLTECPEMPHSQIILMMELMDRIRHQWDFWYPGER